MRLPAPRPVVTSVITRRAPQVRDEQAGALPLCDPDRLMALADSGLTRASDPDMEYFAERVRAVLDVPVALVSLVQADEQVFPGAVGLPEPWASRRGTPLSHSFCQYVVRSGTPLVVTDARRDPLVAENLAIPDLGVVAYAGMPLTDAQGRVLGSLCAIDTRPRAWERGELDVLVDLARACSTELRLRLARFDADRERARRDEMEAQLRGAAMHATTVAHALQAAMLTELPTVAGLALAARYVPADTGELVGGDWYDAVVLPRRDGSPRAAPPALAISVGDIAGHDVDATAVMGQVRAMLRQAGWEHVGHGPARVLTALEEACAGLGLPAVGTAVLAHLHPASGGGGRWSMTWTNAGHPPPVVVRPDGSTLLLEPHDALLGFPALLPGPRRDHELLIEPGSSVVLYSDGLVEHRRRGIDHGIDALRRLLVELADRPAQVTVDALVEHLEGAEGRDDTVALLVRIPPVAGAPGTTDR